MIWRYEAIINESGDVELLKPVKFARARRALVMVRKEAPPVHKLRPYGLAAGQFIVPDDFDAPLTDDLLVELG